MPKFAVAAERIGDDAPYIAAAEELGCDLAVVRVPAARARKTDEALLIAGWLMCIAWAAS